MVERLEQLGYRTVRRGNYFVSHCPNCGPGKSYRLPLDIREGRDGVLVHCSKCEDFPAIVEALGFPHGSLTKYQKIVLSSSSNTSSQRPALNYITCTFLASKNVEPVKIKIPHSSRWRGGSLKVIADIERVFGIKRKLALGQPVQLSMNAISERTGVNVGTVRRVMARLEADKALLRRGSLKARSFTLPNGSHAYKRPGRLYQLSELACRIDLPASKGTLEAAGRVPVVGRVEPDREVVNDGSVPATELDGAGVLVGVGEVQHGRLRAVERHADSERSVLVNESVHRASIALPADALESRLAAEWHALLGVEA